MASLRVKTAAHRRSGDGRECGLLRQNSINRDDSSKSTGRHGHGAQAAAWNASLNFVKSHSPKTTTANNGSSISTSPETDPGASDAFRFFEAGGADDAEGSDGEEPEIDGSISSGSHPEMVVQTRSRKEDSYRNPMFHMANAEVEKAVASLFPGEEEATNCSNPMFNRNVSEAPMALARPRQRSKRERAGRLSRSKSIDDGNVNVSKDKEALSRGEQQFSRSIQSGGGFTARCRVMPAESIKREKAMYEHVGRMNYRPFIDCDEQDLEVKVNGCFRLDTFARNEGDSGGKAHFKFVFTLDDGTSLSRESQDGSVASTSSLSLLSYSSTSTRIASGGEGKKRPVLDAVHDRDTGKMRIRVNDGREINTTNGAVVEIALADVGIVLFNPRTMAKGHHLYTLSLRGRTLFSVLA